MMPSKGVKRISNPHAKSDSENEHTQRVLRITFLIQLVFLSLFGSVAMVALEYFCLMVIHIRMPLWLMCILAMAITAMMEALIIRWVWDTDTTQRFQNVMFPSIRKVVVFMTKFIKVRDGWHKTTEQSSYPSRGQG